MVGEDLGTVEHGVREAMAEHGMLSYRLLYFEDDDPAHWPAGSMAAVTTHDLPTIAGLWTGSDVAEQKQYGTGTDEELETGRAALLEHLGDVPADADPADAVAAAYRRLATAPSTLLSATLDDAVAEERRPNIPGTTDRPNWDLPLPVPTEELAAHPGVQAVAAVLAAGLHPLTTKGKVKGGKAGRSTRKRSTGPAGRAASGRPAAQLCRKASRSALIVSASWSACRAGSPRRSSASRSAAARPTAGRSRRRGRPGRRRRA